MSNVVSIVQRDEAPLLKKICCRFLQILNGEILQKMYRWLCAFPHTASVLAIKIGQQTNCYTTTRLSDTNINNVSNSFALQTIHIFILEKLLLRNTKCPFNFMFKLCDMVRIEPGSLKHVFVLAATRWCCLSHAHNTLLPRFLILQSPIKFVGNRG